MDLVGVYSSGNGRFLLMKEMIRSLAVAMIVLLFK